MGRVGRVLLFLGLWLVVGAVLIIITGPLRLNQQEQNLLVWPALLITWLLWRRRQRTP